MSTNTTQNLFEYATRHKMRFTFRGIISTEDLWDLSLEQLDQMYRELKATIKDNTEGGLLNKQTKTDEALSVAIQIIEHIFKVKQAEVEARKLADAKRAEKQKLLAILANKKEAELEGKSVEELEAMIAALD